MYEAVLAYKSYWKMMSIPCKIHGRQIRSRAFQEWLPVRGKSSRGASMRCNVLTISECTNRRPCTVAQKLLACLQELKVKHPEIMQELLMDVLRVLSTPDMDIRRKTLNIALELTTAHNIEEVVLHPEFLP